MSKCLFILFTTQISSLLYQITFPLCYLFFLHFIKLNFTKKNVSNANYNIGQIRKYLQITYLLDLLQVFCLCNNFYNKIYNDI